MQRKARGFDRATVEWVVRAVRVNEYKRRQAAPGIKVPAGYTDFFKSADGRTRTFVAEATGGPTWYTEFNVLMGLSVE